MSMKQRIDEYFNNLKMLPDNDFKIYNEIIPVTNILCLNTTSKNIEVSDDMDTTILKTKFTEPYNKNNNTGTMIQIYWKVEPDNATTKDVDFVFDENNSRIEMYKIQLEYYKKAVKKIHNTENVESYLYFTKTKEIIEV